MTELLLWLPKYLGPSPNRLLGVHWARIVEADETKPQSGDTKIQLLQHKEQVRSATDSCAGHVTPREEGAYRIDFTELGRPPIYSGTTGLTIHPKERRV
jgi:hypothetical protein